MPGFCSHSELQKGSAMELRVNDQQTAYRHLTLVGRLDTRGVDSVEIKFNALIGPKAKNVLLDFGEVSFLSSMGIRMLLTMARVCSRNGGVMVVLNPQPLVHEAMQHASLDDLIPVVTSIAEAEQAFPA